MARRSKLTDETASRILQAIQAGATYKIAAEYAGITRGTLWKWLDEGKKQNKGRYRTFLDAFKKAEARSCLGALAVINKSAQSGCWQAAAWLLERRHPEGYGRQQQAEVLVSIETENINSAVLIKEYKTKIQPLIEGPIIDLDEE